MYERSAIILERYFSKKFHYNDKNNLKNNYRNYCKLVNNFEKYEGVTEEEDKVISEYEEAANKIRKVQKKQNNIYRKMLKLQEDRNNLFDNIDKTAEEIKIGMHRIEIEIDKRNDEMKDVGKEFVEALREFNLKSRTRAEYGKKRKEIEDEYRKIIRKATNNFGAIDADKIEEIKEYLSSEDTASAKELKEQMLENGKNEEVQFDENVIKNSIEFGKKINDEEARVLIEIFQKTSNLISDINAGNTNIKKYQKAAKKAKSKLTFISAEKEYLIQFLDNERLSAGIGKKEHKKIMKEACEDFQKDVEQINNLHEILMHETEGKATQKLYRELYYSEYEKELEKKEAEFEKKLSKLNMVGKILNPNQWRIDGIKRIYIIFNNIVVNEYGRDLTKFKTDAQIFNLENTDNIVKDIYDESPYLDELDDDDEDDEIEEELLEIGIPKVEENQQTVEEPVSPEENINLTEEDFDLPEIGNEDEKVKAKSKKKSKDEEDINAMLQRRRDRLLQAEKEIATPTKKKGFFNLF